MLGLELEVFGRKYYYMNTKIKVSIVVPIYNVERFLEKCIISILEQTHDNIEVILVDDGSKDKSGMICDKFAEIDDRIIVIHKENNGVSEARNTGINSSTGDYICFVDGDDYIMPDYVEYLLKLAKLNDAEIAITTEMFGNFQEEQVKKDVINIWSAEDALEGILCYRVPIGCYCKLFKRSFLGKEIRFLNNIFIGEGFNFNVAAFQRANKIAVGRRRIYYYRRDNPTSAMTKFSISKCENGLLALEVIKEKLTIHSKRIHNAWNYANWRTHSDFYDMLVLAKAHKEYKDMYRRCLSVTKSDALSAFKVPTSNKNRVRALIMKVYPGLIPKVMVLRKYKYHINMKN